MVSKILEDMCMLLPIRMDEEEVEFAAPKASLWPKATGQLSVRFLDGDKLLRQRVADLINKDDGVNANSGICLVFDQAPDAEIRVSFRGQGNWSYTGTDCLALPLDEPTLNLGPNTHDGLGFWFVRSTQHEFLHALGVGHEQANPHAHIPWDVAKVVEYYHSNYGLSRAEVERNVLQVMSEMDTVASPYDRLSIMGYEVPAGLTVGGFTVPLVGEMSATDKEWLQNLY